MSKNLRGIMSSKNIKISGSLSTMGVFVKKFALPALVSAVVALVAGGVYAVNATPANITVCAAKSNGAMRYSASGGCKNARETKLVLGQQGPAGPAGPVGPIGATGPAGATGAAGSMTTQSFFEVKTSSYTLALTDAGKFLFSRSSPTIVVPNNSAVAFPIGTRIDIGQLGATSANIIFVNPNGGVTINDQAVNSAGTAVSQTFDRGAFQIGVLVKVGTNEWLFLRSPDENSSST
jgi:hypothetical protein